MTMRIIFDFKNYNYMQKNPAKHEKIFMKIQKKTFFEKSIFILFFKFQKYVLFESFFKVFKVSVIVKKKARTFLTFQI